MELKELETSIVPMDDEEIIPLKKSISEDHNDDQPVSLMSDLTDQVFIRPRKKKSNNSIFEKLEHAPARKAKSVGIG